MREAVFTTPVNACLPTVWEVLLDNVEHPENYLPGVMSTKILERYHDGLLREVDANGLVLRERVTFDREAGEIRFDMLEHPLFSGRTINRVVPTARQSPVAPQTLSFIIEWIPRNPEAERIIREDMSQAMQQAVLAVKDEAERRDGRERPRRRELGDAELR